MIIEEGDFRLKQVSEESIFFDLELLYTVNKGKKTERQEFKNAGYGLTLETAIRKIANYRVSLQHIDEAITLKTYFKKYKKELDDLKKLLND